MREASQRRGRQDDGAATSAATRPPRGRPDWGEHTYRHGLSALVGEPCIVAELLEGEALCRISSQEALNDACEARRGLGGCRHPGPIVLRDGFHQEHNRCMALKG